MTTTTPRTTPSKKYFIFYQRNSLLPRSVKYTDGSRNVLKLNMQRRRSIPNGIRKISRRCPGFVDDAEFGHFTSLFGRGRHRNVQRFITHVQSYPFVH